MTQLQNTPLPPGYTMTRLDRRDGQPGTIITHPDGSRIVITGERPATVQLTATDDLGNAYIHDVSNLFGNHATHDQARDWWINAITAGEESA